MIAEVARYIPGLSPSTLRSWIKGRSYPRKHGEGYFRPLIHPPDDGGLLSFNNIIEAYTLFGLRTVDEIKIEQVREALRYAERKEGIPRLLLRRELLTAPGELFLERYGTLVSLCPAGQLAMKEVLRGSLRRVVHDEAGLAKKLFPLLPGNEETREVVIDPAIGFGKPVIAKLGVGVATLAGRLDGGESLETLVKDYGLKEEEIRRAILYARAA
jgi:uncharacterized protein (DUF433 family)